MNPTKILVGKRRSDATKASIISRKKGRTIPPDSKPDSMNKEVQVKEKTGALRQPKKKFSGAIENEIVRLTGIIKQPSYFDEHQIKNCQSFLIYLKNSS